MGAEYSQPSIEERRRIEHWRHAKVFKTETDDAGQDREVEIPFIKGYTVFNVDQIEGLPETYYEESEPKPDIRHGGNQAFYAVDPDYVQMPPFEMFESLAVIHFQGLEDLKFSL
ncbi:hypothetical protein AB838_05960 [Rhodobacteraceae bacterium (ex Bugula neritina AB1)]|nr:hypothetical protein AB838_05960 [Rhodobacteraceae bacterium (ex Bugula neritina AB1)]